jgi:Protein of unknown function DUF262
LFDDLYDFYQREEEETYFLGSIVLIKEEDKNYAEVIDGQQRLTTLTILLASIASMLTGDLRTDFENYIREAGRPHRALSPSRDLPYGTGIGSSLRNMSKDSNLVSSSLLTRPD